MKKQMNWMAALALAIVLPILPLAFIQGCAAGKGTYNPVTNVYDPNATASSLVVTAEKVRATALDLFAIIMETEYNVNQAGKSTPAIHAFAEDLRKNGKSYLDDLTRAKVAFQTARGTAAEQGALSNLSAVLASVQSLLASAAAHFVTLQAAKTK